MEDVRDQIKALAEQYKYPMKDIDFIAMAQRFEFKLAAKSVEIPPSNHASGE
jgi:hypothetical protein